MSKQLNSNVDRGNTMTKFADCNIYKHYVYNLVVHPIVSSLFLKLLRFSIDFNVFGKQFEI